MSLSAAYREISIQLLGKGRGVIPDDVLKEVMKRYPAEWSDEGARLAWNGGRREVKHILRSLTAEQDTEQMKLPGISSMPSVLTLPMEGGYIYKATAFCTYDEGLEHLGVLSRNVSAVTSERDAFQATLDDFEPIMAGTSMTFADAVRKALVP